MSVVLFVLLRRTTLNPLDDAKAFFGEWIGDRYCDPTSHSKCLLHGCKTFMLSDGFTASSTCNVTQDGFEAAIIGINYEVKSRRMTNLIFGLLGPPAGHDVQPMMNAAFRFADRFGEHSKDEKGTERWMKIPIALSELYMRCANNQKRGWSSSLKRDTAGIDMQMECNDLGDGWAASVEVMPLDADEVGHRKTALAPHDNVVVSDAAVGSPATRPIAPIVSAASATRHDFTAEGIALSTLLPVGASPSSRSTGKGTMHAEVGWPSSIVVKDGKQVLDDPRVDITDWLEEKCAEDTQQLAKMAPDGARVERNEHAAGRNVLSYKNADGSYGAFVCDARVGYHCSFDYVSAPIAPKALEVCLTVERVGDKPASPASPATIAPADVQKLVDAQAAALMGSGFADSFAEAAIAFFPYSLLPFEGRTRIGEGAREAWGRMTNVERAAVVVGIDWSVVWATTQWTITLADLKGAIPVRVTELLSQDTNGLHVIAASFSVAPARGATVIADPVPSFAVGVPPDGGPASWLSFPEELATHLHAGDATSLIGSDTNEVALDADEARKLLIKWKNVKLELVGNMRVIDGAGYKIVLAFARWRGPKPTLFRVLGLFVRGEVMAGPAPWELATAHYSVAVPVTGPSLASSASTPATPSQAIPSAHLPTVPTPSSPTNDSPASVMLVTQGGGTAFEAWENGKKILDGPGGIEVNPGRPRTLTIKARGWKDRTLVVDGKTKRVEFKLELLPDCSATLAEPKSVECRAQFCNGHADDARCHSE